MMDFECHITCQSTTLSSRGYMHGSYLTGAEKRLEKRFLAIHVDDCIVLISIEVDHPVDVRK